MICGYNADRYPSGPTAIIGVVKMNTHDTGTACAPGRVELLGNHTDYNEGVVLGAAIDRGLNVTGERREDGLIVVHSAVMGRLEIPRTQLRPQQEHCWANYALGVASELSSLAIPIE